MTSIVDSNTNRFAIWIKSKDRQVSWNDFLHHGVTVLDSLAARHKAQMFVERFVRMISVIQERVGVFNVLVANDTIGILFGGQKTLQMTLKIDTSINEQ